MSMAAAKNFRVQMSSHVSSDLVGGSGFAVDYLGSSVGMTEPTTPWSVAPALHVCVPTLSGLGGFFRLWLNGKEVPVPPQIPSLSCHVIDLRFTRSSMVEVPWSCMFYYLPLLALEEIAKDLGVAAPSEYRLVLAQQDHLIVQFTKLMLSRFGERDTSHALAMDSLGLLLGTHVIQHYGSLRKSMNPARGGLAPWQKKRATEILSARIAGDTSLTFVAKECGLSRSHFARAFKQSLGKSAHSWHAEQRLARAQDLLLDRGQSIAAIATLLGFADQSTFSRSFSKAVGMSPNRWRQISTGTV